MPRQRNYHAEYEARQERAKAEGWSGYSEFRRAREIVADVAPRKSQAYQNLLEETKAYRARGAEWQKIKETMVPVSAGAEVGAARWTEDGVRFVSPGNEWAPGRGIMEVRETFKTKEQAIDYVTNVARARHVLVVQRVWNENINDFEWEVDLDYEAVTG